MSFIIKKAERNLIFVKIALMSPSGGGKTYSALRLGTGALEELKKIGKAKNGKILMANTESSRGLYYADEFTYDILDVTAPHNPEMYAEIISYAVEQDYPILIMDSTSPEWEGKGGCLDLHQQAGGTYQSWAKVTPRHDKFLAALADSPIHIIATMRGKDQYEMERSETGKTTIKKLGVGAKQREGFEYEFTVTFNIDQQTSMATVQKDNTHLFENEGDVKLSEGHGKKIMQWANSGEGYNAPVRNRKTEEEFLSEKKGVIIEKCKSLGGSTNSTLMDLLKKYHESGNPNKINDIEQLNSLFAELSKLKLENIEEKGE